MAKTKTLTFQWEGTNKRGQKIEGEMLGENSAIVKAQLRKQGITPGKVKKKAKPSIIVNEGVVPEEGRYYTIYPQLSLALKNGMILKIK
mgnify:CR=1 FL=1